MNNNCFTYLPKLVITVCIILIGHWSERDVHKNHFRLKIKTKLQSVSVLAPQCTDCCMVKMQIQN